MRKLSNDELERKTIDQFKNTDKLSVVLVMDNVRSLNNIGSVFRTCDAFLVEALYLCGITGTPPNKDIHKTALGATESVAWQYFDTTVAAVRQLKQNGYTIASLEQVEGSVFLNNFIPQKNTKYALVFGNEVNGVGQEVVDLSDFCIEIPQFGTKHSFNIAVSAGIVLWDFFTKIQRL